MKLKYFVPMFIMALAMLTSCSDDEVVTYPDGLRVSSSYMALPFEGGSASIDVYCNQKWEVDTVGAFPKKEPWFDYSVSSSDKGQVLTITADETLDGRSTSIKLVTEGGTTQIINVMQGLSTVSTATCAEVIAGPDSKTYQVKGVCTSIANTTYGNWYLKDDTGEIYIYGTLDKNGKEKNFLSLGLEVGDEVIVQGPKTTHGSTVELVNVTVIAINKSLIKVDSTYVGGVASNELPLEGGELTAYVTCKGQGVSVDIPEDAKDWLSIAAIKNGGSEVVFKAAPNAGGDRNTTVIFKTTDGELASKLTHPKYVKKKIYHVWVDKPISEDDMQHIADGVELEDGEIHADAISYVSETDKKQAGIEIHSGRNRVVRRIFEALGYHVTKLDRVYFAGLTKKNLPRGRWRYLTQEEVNYLKQNSFE